MNQPSPDPEALRAALIPALAAAGPASGIDPKIVVAPHAGIAFSAGVATTAFAPWARRPVPPRRIVMIGPAHRVAFKGLVLHPAAAFATPLVPLDRIARYRFDPNSGHRLQTEGIVTSVMEGRSFSIQQGLCGVRVQTVSSPPLKAGDRVQVAGFLDMSRQIAGISDAIVEVVGHGAVPVAERISPQEIIQINTDAMGTPPN
jgi:hypothetical protein